MLSAPKDLVLSLRSTGQLAGTPEVVREWMRSSGADVLARPEGLIQLDGVASMSMEKGVPHPAFTFDAISVEAIAHEVQLTEDAHRGLQSSLWSYDPGAIFVFKTREGRRGVLEILEQNARGLRFRYKLLQHLAPTTSPVTGENAAIHPVSPSSAFGPLIETLVDGWIDFDTGKVVPRVSPATDEELGRMRAELPTEGFDAALYGKILIGVGMKAIGLKTESWDNATPEQLNRVLVEADPGSSGWKFITPAGEEQPTATYAFSTREGTMGLLQLRLEKRSATDWPDAGADPYVMKVRYKLLPASASRPTASEVIIDAAGGAVRIRKGEQSMRARTIRISTPASQPSSKPTAEALIAKATAFVDLLNAGDFASAVAQFDATMQREMPESKLTQFWQDLQHTGGSFQGYDAARFGIDADHPAVYIPCRWERNRWIIEVVFNTDGSVGGLWNLLWQSNPATSKPAVPPAPPAATRPTAHSTDQIVVEDLALEMLVAIREKEDAKLQGFAVDKIKGWRDALPHFALEMRERFTQMTGKPFTMYPSETLIQGDRAVVKCTGPKELGGVYLVLFFVKTDQGWRNWSLRNSPAGKPLSEHLKIDPDAPPTSRGGRQAGQR